MYDAPSAIIVRPSNGLISALELGALQTIACDVSDRCTELVLPFERWIICWSLGGGALSLMLLGLLHRMLG